MRRVNISYNDFDRLFIHNKCLNVGVEGMIFEYNNDLLSKIQTKTYFGILEGTIDDNPELVKRISILSSKQTKVHNTLLPTGVIFFNNKPIASLNPWIKNSTSLSDFIISSRNKDVLEVLRKVIVNANELYDNGIINIDLGGNNILVNNNKDVYIIDLDSASTILDDEIRKDDKFYLSTMYHGLIKEFFDLLSIKENNLYNELDSIYSYKDYYGYIDSLINSNSVDKIKRRKYGSNRL